MMHEEYTDKAQRLMPNLKIDGSVVLCPEFEPEVLSLLWQDNKINLIEVGWNFNIEPPLELRTGPRIYNDRVKINVLDSNSILEEQLTELLLGGHHSPSEVNVANLVSEQQELASRFARMVDLREIFACVWSMLPTKERSPEASDFIHRDGLRDETILEPNSPILLRSYGETMRFVRKHYVNAQQQEDYFQRLLKLIDDSKHQAMPKHEPDFQNPSGQAAHSFLKSGAQIEAIRLNHLAIFRTGRDNGLYHCSPWPSDWRLNFQLSVPHS